MEFTYIVAQHYFNVKKSFKISVLAQRGINDISLHLQFFGHLFTTLLRIFGDIVTIKMFHNALHIWNNNWHPTCMYRFNYHVLYFFGNEMKAYKTLQIYFLIWLQASTVWKWITINYNKQHKNMSMTSTGNKIKYSATVTKTPLLYFRESWQPHKLIGEKYISQIWQYLTTLFFYLYKQLIHLLQISEIYISQEYIQFICNVYNHNHKMNQDPAALPYEQFLSKITSIICANNHP